MQVQSAKAVDGHEEKKYVVAVCLTAETSGAVFFGAVSAGFPCLSAGAVPATTMSCDLLKTQTMVLPGCCSEPLNHSQS